MIDRHVVFLDVGDKYGFRILYTFILSEINFSFNFFFFFGIERVSQLKLFAN